jgi:hypothetical protein
LANSSSYGRRSKLLDLGNGHWQGNLTEHVIHWLGLPSEDPSRAEKVNGVVLDNAVNRSFTGQARRAAALPRRNKMVQQIERPTGSPDQPKQCDHDGPHTDSAIVAVYKTHDEAEAAVRDLQRSGYDMTKLSIVGKDYDTSENVVGYYNTGDRMLNWGAKGAFWGGLWSMLFGSAYFLIPGVGPILAAGPIVVWIVGVLEGAAIVGGLSALGAALFSIGIPKDSILAYETQIKAGDYLVIARETPGAFQGAAAILSRTGHQGIEQHCLHTENKP